MSAATLPIQRANNVVEAMAADVPVVAILATAFFEVVLAR